MVSDYSFFDPSTTSRLPSLQSQDETTEDVPREDNLRLHPHSDLWRAAAAAAAAAALCQQSWLVCGGDDCDVLDLVD